MGFISKLFGGGEKKSTPPPQMPSVPKADVMDDEDEEKKRKKRLGRASLIATTPGGDLTQANTATGKILGN